MSELFAHLTTVISARQSLVKNYLFSEQNRLNFAYQHLQDAVYSYVNAGGKSLRPAVLMFACGAVGGDELTAIPAAATVELYHTFTLVHDDI
ncbi:MAG TPA: polyprenyl synthetase family protein, partial [Aggregatilineales bacterium]|nr:polyprenyl synthetase family protein [Aggregatilineales bacterium]